MVLEADWQDGGMSELSVNTPVRYNGHGRSCDNNRVRTVITVFDITLSPKGRTS